MNTTKTQKPGLLANLASFVGLKKEVQAEAATPVEKTAKYVAGLDASDSVKTEAERLMRQGITTLDAVDRNLEKAEARQKAEARDQEALGKLVTDLEQIAAQVITNQEKTKDLHKEAAALEQSNTEVRNVLSGTSFAQILAATKAASQNTPVV